MNQQLLDSRIDSLSNEYGFETNKIREYYSMLEMYPFIEQSEDDNKALDCLEMVVQDRLANTINSELNRSIRDSVEEAVYRVYDDMAIGFLSEKFIKTREIETSNYNNHPKVLDYSYTDNIYNGYR